MRTALDLDDALVRRAKRRAAEEDTTLTAVLGQALREHLVARRAPGKRFRLRLLTKRGRLVPGVDLADRDALYERSLGVRMGRARMFHGVRESIEASNSPT